MALSSQIVNLIGSNPIDQLHHIGRVSDIAIMQVEVGMLIEPIDSLRIKAARPTFDAVDLITF